MAKTKPRAKPKKGFSEEDLDSMVNSILSCPGVVETLLSNKEFLREAVKETRKVKKDPIELKGLGNKYGASPQETAVGLSEVEELFVTLLGKDED